MARLKEFDEERAIDKAVDCFWARGYGATSVRDLADAMGIGGTSLYNAADCKGCLLVKSALDVAPHDAAIGAAVGGYLDEIRAFFRRNLEAARRTGAVSKSLDVETVSGHLLGVLVGIRALARVKRDRKLLESIARPALALLDPKTRLH